VAGPRWPRTIWRGTSGASRAEATHSRPNIGYCVCRYFYLIPQGLVPVQSGALKGAGPADVIAGQGLTCAPPPPGYKHRGFATAKMSVPPNTYPYYVP
jgi:hypothetical protein